LLYQEIHALEVMPKSIIEKPPKPFEFRGFL